MHLIFHTKSKQYSITSDLSKETTPQITAIEQLKKKTLAVPKKTIAE